MPLQEFCLEKSDIVQAIPRTTPPNGLLMKACLGFGGVAGMVEFQQAVQDLLADHGTDGVAGALTGVMETVIQT